MLRIEFHIVSDVYSPYFKSLPLCSVKSTGTHLLKNLTRGSRTVYLVLYLST